MNLEAPRLDLHAQHLGALFAPAFFAAMVQEGGRVESESGNPAVLWDWLFTYINL
jgi:hypothetical protein